MTKKYYGIDWLRAIACIGIMAMHVASNNKYNIGGFAYDTLIPSFTDFVFLFMAVSAFGMCSGYYNKVLSGEVNWTTFYKKRYAKILPFFLFLIIIDLIMGFSKAALFEGLTEVTLLHGFIPSSLLVIGVGWFLGVVFIFYLIFPFYCVLIETKCRAWCAFLVSIVLNYICSEYFKLDRKNFVYSLCFFLAGGLVFLYKENLAKIKWYLYLPIIILAILGYYFIGANTLTLLFLTVSLLAFAISINVKKIGIISFISNISLEIYLSHMLIFRAVEMVKLNTRFGNGWLQYFITFGLVLIGTIIFAFISQTLINKAALIFKKK